MALSFRLIWRAEIGRIRIPPPGVPPPRSVNVTCNHRSVSVRPRAWNRRSRWLCFKSSARSNGAFRKTCSTSGLVTPCFSFFLALPSSQSNPMYGMGSLCICLQYTTMRTAFAMLQMPGFIPRSVETPEAAPLWGSEWNVEQYRPSKLTECRFLFPTRSNSGSGRSFAASCCPWAPLQPACAWRAFLISRISTDRTGKLWQCRLPAGG